MKTYIKLFVLLLLTGLLVGQVSAAKSLHDISGASNVVVANPDFVDKLVEKYGTDILVPVDTDYTLYDVFDKDRDGVFNAEDNCLIVSNADQTDSDGDDIGNACDVDNTDGPLGNQDSDLLSDCF